MKSKTGFTSAQLAYQDIVVGTLVYVLVLGLFNDYSSIVYAKSFSWIFFAAIVLQLLTFVTFKFKSRILRWLSGRTGATYALLRVFCIWLIMFLSKFLFIWVLDLIFGSYIRVEGFFGILAVVVSVLIIQRLAYAGFRALGSTPS